MTSSGQGGGWQPPEWEPRPWDPNQQPADQGHTGPDAAEGSAPNPFASGEGLGNPSATQGPYAAADPYGQPAGSAPSYQQSANPAPQYQQSANPAPFAAPSPAQQQFSPYQPPGVAPGPMGSNPTAGYPGYGNNPYAQSYAPVPYTNPYGFGIQTQTTNGLAIGSLVASISSMFLCIGWIPGLIMGFIALGQIKANPEKYSGRGIAIGGIVTGAIFGVFMVLFMIIGVATS